MVVCCLGFAIALNAQTPIPTNQWAAIYRFNEETGTTTADASWNDNTGTISNAVWTTAGKYGSCLSFDGRAWVTVNDSPSLDLTNGMTLEAWVYPASAISGWRTFIMKEIPNSGDGGNYGYMLAAEPDGHPVIDVSTTSGNYQQAMGPSTLPLNTWTHLAGTYDGTTLKLYVNGIEVAETPATGSILTSPQPLRIGGNAIWPEYFSGKIDEVRIYNQALSKSQIQTNMNGLDVLTVTVDSTNRVYGSANPAFTGSVAGLLAGDNITATFTTVATPANPVGDYDVVPSFNDPDGSLNNYFVVTNVGTLTIDRATPVLTLSASAITYGQTLADSSLSGSVATNAENNAPVAGSFAFQDDTITPNEGSTNVSVIFTPADAADYNHVTNIVSVMVTPPGKILITSIVLLETNHELITGTGSANVTYIIQASPDLIYWQSIGTATAGTNGVFEFEDADAGNFTTRFYRVNLP